MACAAALSFAAAEAVLRLTDLPIARHSDHMFVVVGYDARLGWKMKPLVQATIDMFDTENIPVRANADGLWDRPFVSRKSPDRTRIAFLGDSYTWGYGVQEEERFASVLEARNPRIESMNFGIPAYGSDQALLMWREVASRYAPDVVVLTVVPNDYEDNMSSVRWGRAKPYFAMGTNAELRLMNSPAPQETFWDNGILHGFAPPYAHFYANPIQVRSRTLDWLAKHSDIVRLCHTLCVRPPPRATAPRLADASQLSEVERQQFELLTAIVRELADSVRRANARLLVVLADDHPLYRLQLSQFAADGIDVLDLTTDVLAGRMGVPPADIYFKRNPHWRPETQKVVADMVAQKLEDLPREASPGTPR